MQLRNELRDKEMKLTDIRLEALSSAHQLDQLREAMNRMQVSGRQTESQEAAEWQPRGERVRAGMLAVAASLPLSLGFREWVVHTADLVWLHTVSSFHSGPLYSALSLPLLPSLAPHVTHYLSGTVMSDCPHHLCHAIPSPSEYPPSVQTGPASKAPPEPPPRPRHAL